MRKALTIAMTLVIGSANATAAFADHDCFSPMRDWQPREAVLALAEANGWVLRRIRIDDDCYKLIGTDAAGNPLHIRLDPATLEQVMGHDDDHDEDDIGHFDD